MKYPKTVTILLVEDDPGHARLIRKNLERAGIHNPLIHVEDGRKAVDFLFCEGEHAGKTLPKPLLVLLDLNLPELDGIQVLRRMKENRATKSVPVVVLTTSGNAHEVELCYELGCNIFIQKPVEYEAFCEAVKKFGMFLEIIMLPEGD